MNVSLRLPVLLSGVPGFLLMVGGAPLQAQVLPQGGGSAQAQSSNQDSAPPPQQKKKENMLGDAVPFLDPGSETASWDGKMWNVGDNRLFRARLEKYLAAPEANTQEDEAYRKVLEEINECLAPGHNGGKPSLPQAVALLPIAAKFPIDAKLCDSLANAIYGVWLSQKNVANLRQTNDAMKQQVKDHYFFGSQITPPISQQAPMSGGKNGVPNPGAQAQQAAQQLGIATEYIKDIAELEAKMKANELAMGATQVSAKAEFQALIIQFAMQRRFEHVIMACRLYRLILEDANGIIQLQKGSDSEKMFASSLGTSPTISALDSFANEMIRDVDEGVQAFDELLSRGDLSSASQRISEAFMVGEYLPRVRRVSMDKKLKVLDYTRDINQLVSALQIKDYKLGEELVTKMRAEAKDFDYSKPQAAIETAGTLSDMSLNKAKVAAMQGDEKSSAEALRQAAEIWPTNPKLKEFTTMIGNNADIKTQAALDLDRLLSQRNYRQIYNDQGRYLAAVMDDPARQQQLKKVLTDMNRMNLVIAAATGNEQHGNVPGAWETVEQAYKEFPEDPELARLRSDLSVKATEFVGALQRAKEHEDRKQTGTALAWYLKAKSQYPPSEFADEGIRRIVDGLHKD